ncbi:MAG TPA: helix-turn-helix transcriptional regulator [Methylocella sp.]|jgi:transcriptional regulator with XRE-family HTH domain
MTLRERVARNLRMLRQAKGLSQEELADRADINRNYVGMLEREEHAATVDMLEKLADVLEVDPIEFFVSAPDGTKFVR